MPAGPLDEVVDVGDGTGVESEMVETGASALVALARDVGSGSRTTYASRRPQLSPVAHVSATV